MIYGTPYLPVYATEKPVAFLPAATLENNRFTIQRIERYLSGISTIVSDFTQIAPDSSLTNGKFFMKRPGKMRWQYNPPTPVLMVSSGSELVFYDYELDQVSHIPLDGSLISFLAQDKIIFGGKVGITRFSNEANAIRIEVAQKDKPTEGKLMLEFSDKPLTLRNMVITDATGQTTTVALENAKFGTELDPDLFIFREPTKKHR